VILQKEKGEKTNREIGGGGNRKPAYHGIVQASCKWEKEEEGEEGKGESGTQTCYD